MYYVFDLLFYQQAFDLHALNVISFQFCTYSQGNADHQEREEPRGLLVPPEFRECPDPPDRLVPRVREVSQECRENQGYR